MAFRPERSTNQSSGSSSSATINSKKSRVLRISTKNRFSKIINALLNQKGQVTPVHASVSQDGYTTLHFAAERRNSLVVRLLLECGADVNAITVDNLMPIHIAIKRGHKKMTQILLDAGADVNAVFESGASILSTAAEKGNVTMLKSILEHRPDINLKGNKLAIKAGIFSHSDNHNKVVTCLYQYGFRLDDDDFSSELLFKAIRKGHGLVIENFLQNGGDVNVEIMSPGIAINLKGTLLYFAVIFERVDIVKLLLDYGAYIHPQDIVHKTPLLVAAEKNNLVIIKMLIKYGANINDTDVYNRTCLHHAVLQKIRRSSKKGTEWVAFNNKMKIVKFFLSRGADINMQTNNNGSTCLHIAAYQGLCNVVNHLLKNNADANIINHRNVTALEYALDYMHAFDDRQYFNQRNTRRRQFERYSVESRVQTFRLLQQHVHRMQKLGLFVCPGNISAKDRFIRVSRYFDHRCNEELKQMVTTKIGKSSVNYYSFLTKDIGTIVKYITNRDVVIGLSTANTELQKFSGFWYLIENRAKIAVTQKRLDDETEIMLRSFFDDLPALPTECYHKILSYFDNNEKEYLLSHFVYRIF